MRISAHAAIIEQAIITTDFVLSCTFGFFLRAVRFAGVLVVFPVRFLVVPLRNIIIQNGIGFKQDESWKMKDESGTKFIFML